MTLCTYIYTRTHASTQTHTYMHCMYILYTYYNTNYIVAAYTFNLIHAAFRNVPIQCILGVFQNLKNKAHSVHTLLIQCYYIVHWELVVIIIAMSPCLRTRCRKEAHLSIKFSDDSDYQYFTSTMTWNHKNNCYFCHSAHLWDIF